MSVYIILFLFGALIFGMPVAYVLGVASLLLMFQLGDTSLFPLIPMRFFNSINLFPLMAMPLFILAGEIMNRAGITSRVIDFSTRLVGHLRGGLAHANILASILFAGLTGSAVADSAALGSMLIPGMARKGYDKNFAAAVTAASSCIGPVIPPSIVMVIYGAFMQVSIAGLFAAGIVPGLIMGITLMTFSHRISVKRSYPKEERRATLPELFTDFKKAFLSLMMPIIILVGILGGIFTPTEAAAVAVLYALIIGFFVYRNITLRDLYTMLCSMTRSSGIAFIVLSTAGIFIWLLTTEQVPQQIAEFVLSVTQNKYLVLLIINLILLFVGCFMDSIPALIILGPVFTPLATQIGVHPLHFGTIMCLNLTIGLATPPLGACLFTCCAVGKVNLEGVTKEIIPFIAALIIAVLFVTYIPAISLTIPRLLGLL
ncbi:MAG: TRAP transporter large permease [Desulfobacter sp.]